MQCQDRVGLGLGVSLVLPPTPTILEPVISSPRVLISPGCENSQGPHWGCLRLQGWGGGRYGVKATISLSPQPGLAPTLHLPTL